MQFRPAQFAQTWMASCQTVLPHVILQHSVRPQLVRVTEILRLLTGTVQYPGDRIIRDAATLARSRQFPQRRIDSKLKELADAQCNRVAIHAVGNGDRVVAHAVGALQENGCVKHLPFLRATGSPEILKSLSVRCRQGQWLTLRDEWHKPFCHESV